MPKIPLFNLCISANEDSGQTVILSTKEDFDKFLRPIVFDVFQSVDFEKLASCISPQTKYITCRNIEREFGISEKTLEYWRSEGIGPAYTQVGKRVYYERKVFEAFLKSYEVQTTGTVDDDF